MKEINFIKELEHKAQEQRRLVATEMIPSWARGIGNWLVVNPWRVVMPLAFMAYGLWRMVYGVGAREFILGLFGGFIR